MFDLERSLLRVTCNMERTIDAGRKEPHQKSCRVSDTKRKTSDQEVAQMLSKRIIRPSLNPWFPPVVLLPKKDRSMPFCIGYYRLNKTFKDIYPMPRIDNTLCSMQGTQCFSSLDLRSGYWQIPVAERGRPEAAFATLDKLF